MPTIDIINASTVVSDAELAAMVPALQIQVSRDFAKHYGRNPHLNFVPKGAKPTAIHWWLTVLDDAPSAGYLGFHDTTSTGRPLGKVFAETDLKYGNLVSVTLSHELLEMVADPQITLCVQYGHLLYSFEACDAVEKDSDGYDINGVQVSNFVLPAWYGDEHPTATYDHLGQLTAPRTLRPGGYVSVLDLNSSDGWQQIMADSPSHAASYKARPSVGSRRERRRTPRSLWLPSTVDVA